MTIVLGVVLGVAWTAALIAGISWIARRATRRTLEAPEQFGASHLVVARLVGAYGTGGGLVRGNGALGVHHRQLVYSLGTPRRVHTLPLRADTTVEVTRTLSFPGRKAVLWVPAVVVRTGDAGLAVMVKEPEALATTISAAVPRGTS